MTLNTLWFILLAILWTGFFVLEGFDFGVGTLLHPVGRDERGKRAVINTIGPVWDGNEVWLLTAGGAMFAAFPQWYATVFSAYYLPLFIILVCLIVRGVAFEYRGKGDTDQWRKRWDLAINIVSPLPALLFGVAFGGMVAGLPLDADHEYIGTFWNLLAPFALITGVTTLLLFTFHGAVFLGLKTGGEVRERAQKWAVTLGPFVVAVLVVQVIWQQVVNGNVGSMILGIVAVVAAVAAWLSARADRDGWSFVFSAVTVLGLVVSWFASLYPELLPSTADPAGTLTITNAASSPYTLTVMTWVAVCLVPFVLAYQAWSYWVFRRRVWAHQIPVPATPPKDPTPTAVS